MLNSINNADKYDIFKIHVLNIIQSFKLTLRSSLMVSQIFLYYMQEQKKVHLSMILGWSQTFTFRRGTELSLGVKSVILYLNFISSYKIYKKNLLWGDMSPSVPPLEHPFSLHLVKIYLIFIILECEDLCELCLIYLNDFMERYVEFVLFFIN